MTAYGFLKLGLLALAAAGTASVFLSLLFLRRIHIFAAVPAIAALAGGWIYVQSHFIEPHWIEVREVRIQNEKLAEVLSGTRVLHISDIHLNDGLGYREEQLVKLVNREKPDLLFFTGDIIDDLTQVEPAVELFRRLNVRLGIYAVPGNTDHIVMDSATLERKLAPAGINMLINESRKLVLPNGREVWIAGVDDPKYGHDLLRKTLAGIPADAAKILLAHNPEIFKEAAAFGAEVILAGDTHGGQVGIDFLIRMSDYANRSAYMRGHHQEGETQMYVNRGIGMKTLPIRFLCRPEISVIKFV